MESQAAFESSVMRFLESQGRASPQPPAPSPPLAALITQQEQHEEVEEEQEEGFATAAHLLSADEQRRWHEWDQHGYQHSLLTQHDTAFSQEINTWGHVCVHECPHF